MEKYIFWENIKEVGVFKGFFGTWFTIIFKPRAFWVGLKSSRKVLPPFLFSWLNIFGSALLLTFVYGPKVGYMKPQGLYEIVFEIGFMIIVIPVIFGLPLVLASYLIHLGLLSNNIKSDLRLIFRLVCYSFSAVFLIFQIGVPLSRYPFSYVFISLWLITMVVFALKNIFEMSLKTAINSSVFLAVILVSISLLGFAINSRSFVEHSTIFFNIFVLPSYLFVYGFCFYNSVKEGWDWSGGM